MKVYEIMEKKFLETHDSFVWKVMAYFPMSKQIIHCPKEFKTFLEAQKEMDDFKNGFHGIVDLKPYLAEKELR